MTELISSLLRGVGTGSVYALLALGFVIIYKSTRVINFAQPALMLAGAVLVSYLVGPLGFFVAVAVAVAATAMLALGLERSVVRPMIGKPVFIIAIITIGIDIALRNVVNGFIGTDVRQVGSPWGLQSVRFAGVSVQERHIAMLLTALVIITVLFLFFKYSRLGLAMRATAFDQETALSQGVSVSTVFALSWAIAGGMAAVAGVFVASNAGIDQQIWIVALKALPAIIIGGLESLEGAIIGGITVGVVESLVATYQSDFAPWLGSNFSVVSPYVVMLIVLMVRPYGLFGTKEVQRV
ncbi:branched-chain amino acid ABC transporter permease [Haloechinothrix sp. YIM 98757]|uniref:Branched-chain amino acid ABC transporter permease n=1 Tax=Haloechinothrix aidingensis TaxID=2752311 RepID=A0A838A9N2_9PSEU|nr:branched-chain amino acid ABC transporter permease [Haloechinothrix aidingensis]MBA0125489.1 branched-chain amino acid ABC transporter permease [Haloechinothrix aidingensis]